MFSFQEISNQEDIKSSLIRQVSSGKLHHAHLFLGKMGYGSLPLALAFVRYVYCTQKTATDSCGQCSNCSKIDKFQHPDIHYTLPSFESKVLSDSLLESFKQITLDTNGIFDISDWLEAHQKKNAKIRTDEMDIIINNMTMSAYEDGYKTQIIWMAELMDKESNKILKILEEPNPNTIFILLSESGEDILPTIISRCNVHKISAGGSQDIASQLEKEYSQTQRDIIEKAVIFSEGNIIAARRYIEDFDSKFSLEENLRNFLKGLIKFEERKISNIRHFLQFSEDIAGQSKSVQLKFLEYMLYFLRQLVLYKHIGQVQVSESIQKVIEYYAPLLEIDQIACWMESVEKTMSAIEGNANVKLSFVSLAIEFGRIQNRNEFEVNR